MQNIKITKYISKAMSIRASDTDPLRELDPDRLQSTVADKRQALSTCENIIPLFIVVFVSLNEPKPF